MVGRQQQRLFTQTSYTPPDQIAKISSPLAKVSAKPVDRAGMTREGLVIPAWPVIRLWLSVSYQPIGIEFNSYNPIALGTR